VATAACCAAAGSSHSAIRPRYSSHHLTVAATTDC
jgi:hypothetical protein